MKDFTEGYRKPSKTEKEQMSAYMTKTYKKKMKLYNGTAIVCLFLAILLLYDAVLYRHLSGIPFTIIKVILAIPCAVISYFSRGKGAKLSDMLAAYDKGDFYLALCKGYETKNESDKNYMKVHKGAQFMDDWHEIDAGSVHEWKQNKDYLFKLSKYTYEDKKEEKIRYELFSDSKLK